MREEGYQFDVAYTSVLTRAIRTLWLVLDELNQMYIPVHRHWRLNERHYGGLQGLNKAETAAKHGEEQVLIWRRSFDTPPPTMTDDAEYSGFDRRYADLDSRALPRAESLKNTIERVLPYWHDVLVPQIRSGKRVLIAAHGNSLRALLYYLDQLSPEQVLKLNIPTGLPLVYELDEQLQPINSHYLEDPEVLQQRIAAVAQQGKAK